MSYTVKISPSAFDDIQEAILYYESKQQGLGKKFQNSVDQKLYILSLSPFFAIRYSDIRCIKTNRFPYLIHYQIDEEQKTVLVRAVLHTSLDPDKWVKRYSTF